MTAAIGRIDASPRFADKPAVTLNADPLSAVAALPLWDGTPRFDVLDGGISNLSYVATDRRGRYVVRLTRDFPFHDVYRDREGEVARAAYRAGLAPELLHAGPGVMISRYLDAKTLGAADVRRDIPRVAELVRRFHREVATGSTFTFDVFAVNAGYLRALAEHASASRMAEWSAIHAKLSSMRPNRVPVFGHHDLLPGNILDDGRRLWLIDFEYAGHGDARFDLGNLASNAQFTPAQSRELLGAYFDHEGHDDAAPAHRVMEAASLLREGLWSLVSRQHIRERNVDYAGYAEQNFARLDDVLVDL